MLDGDAAGEVHRRGRICSKRLSYVGFFGHLSCRNKKGAKMFIGAINSNLTICFYSILRPLGVTVKVDIFGKQE